MSVTVVVVDPAFEADAAFVLGSELVVVEELVGEGAVEALGFAVGLGRDVSHQAFAQFSGGKSLLLECYTPSRRASIPHSVFCEVRGGFLCLMSCSRLLL